MKIRLVQSSGRFDESVENFTVAVDRYLQLQDPDVLLVTEVDRNARARVLQRPGYNATWGDKGPRDDCGITSKKATFEVIYEETHTVSHRTYVNERGHETDTTEAAFQVLQDANGDRIVVGILHTPHGMGPELRKDQVRSDVARAYVGISRGFFRRGNQLMRRFKAKRAALSGDWNLNFRFAWVRAWFRKKFSGWRINWDPTDLPAKGTHGRWIIDGTFLKGLRVKGESRVLKRDPHDDHTAYVMDLVDAA